MADRRPIPPALLSRLNGVPLLLEPRVFASMMAATVAAPFERSTRGHDYEVVGGIGIVRVRGILMHRGTGMDWLDELFGIASVESIQATFRAALADPAVAKIMLDVDSPGGEVSGLFDLSDEIFAARDTKPIVGVANEWAASGGYLLLCAASRAVGPRTHVAGSVGAMIARIDLSAFDEALGIKYEVFTSGARKADGNPHVAMSDEERANLTRDVSTIGRLFEQTVARNRGTDAQAIRDLEADVFRGKEAVRVGLIDAVQTFDSALKALAADAGGRRKTGMSTEKKPGEGEQPDASQPKLERPKGELVELQPHIEAATKAAIAAERGRVATITKACADAKLPELAPSLIEQGVTADEATVRIEGAKVIVAKCGTAKRPELVAGYLARGLTIEQAKAELADRLIEGDGPEITTSHRAETANAAPKSEINVAAIYDHYNAEQRRAQGRN